MPPTRRQLLIGGAALTAAAVTWEAVDLPPPAPDHRILSADELGVVDAYADALFPPGNPLGPPATELRIGDEVDRIVAEQEPLLQQVFRYALRALVVGTYASRQAHFVDLPLAVRQEIVANWQSERVMARRLLADAIRMEVGMAYFNLPAVQEAIGWVPSCDTGRT